ncbi:MAG: energy transducer TonB [Gammaproteobacteria bacterium]|nr:energy transducer TonB [Gammaproteobacteria bacterium]MBT5205290.1 energy transducer TonB [Gammaproteobacteria bacterium]MBT5602598.1 energy transducer TonB [Gammaproteobacteria bacterium]MBT6245804.1 energy transducer TonB [Gammaproteobacteria bacterium]
MRFSISTIVGVFVTLALFYLMQYLIQGAENAITDDKVGNLVDFVRVKQDQEVQTKQRKPKKPPPPDEPPPDVPPQNFNVAVDNAGFSMSNVDLSVNVDVGGGGFGISDGEYLPIVKVSPQYPRRALSRGMAGWVIVEFIVTAQGTVTNPIVVSNCGYIPNMRSPGVCEDSPNTVFNNAALKAAVKFKYKPKVIDGQPVETAGVQNKIIFELADS